MILESERLKLRLFTEEDVEEVVRLCNNPNMNRYTLNIPYPYTEEIGKAWIEGHKKALERNNYEFAITHKDSGKLCGAIALYIDGRNNRGEIGYWIGEPYWNNGYATEAGKTIIDFAFNKKGLHKVVGGAIVGNIGSSRVLEKTGMIKEGLYKEHVLKDNKYMDLAYYGIINSENKKEILEH